MKEISYSIKNQLDCIVPDIKAWFPIIQNAHLVDRSHFSIEDTLAEIEERKWLIENNIQGLSKSFNKNIIKTCVNYKLGRQRTHTSTPNHSFK